MRHAKSTLALLGLSLCLIGADSSLAIAKTTPPKTAAQAPAQQAEPERPATVMDELSANKEAKEFLSLVKDAGLADALRSKTDTYTVFVPTNAAIDKIPSEARKKIKSDKNALQAFVKYHVISGSLVFSENMRGRRASPSMMSGEMVSFDGMSSSDQKINDAKLVTKDIVTKNGIVHLIDVALVPPSFNPQAAMPPRPAMENMPQRERIAPPAAAMPPSPAAAAPATQPEQPKDDRPWWKRLFSK